MIGCGTRYRGHGLDDIETIHPIVGSVHFAPACELACVGNMPGSAGKKIRIERDNHVGLFDGIDGMEVVAKGKFCPLALSISSSGLPLVPFCFGVERQQLANL